jgi:hypothetical protein
MTIETPFSQFRKQLEQIPANHVRRTFTGVLRHPMVPLDDIQITVSGDDALRREVVHPVQDRCVE